MMSNKVGPSLDATVRELLLLMPQIMRRVKRLPIPEELQSFDLKPRHLSLLSYLLFDGPMTVSELADRLNVAPTTISLIVSELSRKGVLVRCEDDADRRRRIIDISPSSLRGIDQWLSPGARAWRLVLHPLTPSQRKMFVTTLHSYEECVAQLRSQII